MNSTIHEFGHVMLYSVSNLEIKLLIIILIIVLLFLFSQSVMLFYYCFLKRNRNAASTSSLPNIKSVEKGIQTESNPQRPLATLVINETLVPQVKHLSLNQLDSLSIRTIKLSHLQHSQSWCPNRSKCTSSKTCKLIKRHGKKTDCQNSTLKDKMSFSTLVELPVQSSNASLNRTSTCLNESKRPHSRLVANANASNASNSFEQEGVCDSSTIFAMSDYQISEISQK